MHEHAQELRIEVQDVDDLGIVAGIVDEIGLVEEIDRLLGTHPQEHLSCGQAVKAMILNGLGFLSAPLYLFEQFFVGKATEHLIGTGIRPHTATPATAALPSSSSWWTCCAPAKAGFPYSFE